MTGFRQESQGHDKDLRVHNVFHATLLRHFKENDIYGEIFTEPPPDLLEGEEVYEVETILNLADVVINTT